MTNFKNVEYRHSDGIGNVVENPELEPLFNNESCQNLEELPQLLEVTQENAMICLEPSHHHNDVIFVW